MAASNFQQEHHHLLPTSLFSPSKAAAQRAQAADWASVESWLSARYQGRSVPIFERNEDTLKALQALLTANERADEERDALATVQREALVELKVKKEKSDKECGATVNRIITSLDASATTALQNLVSVAVATDSTTATSGIMPVSESLASSLIDLTQTSHELTNHLLALNHLQSRLENELSSLRTRLQELRSPSFQPASSLGRQTLEWSRNTKQLKGKLQEYSDRLATLKASNGGGMTDGYAARGPPSFDPQDLLTQELRLEEVRKDVSRLEKQIDAFQGLPRDKDAARREVKKAEERVMELRRRRDGLFEVAAG